MVPGIDVDELGANVQRQPLKPQHFAKVGVKPVMLLQRYFMWKSLLKVKTLLLMY